MAKKRQSRKCGALRVTDGLPCEAYAINGGTVCRKHGGQLPNVKVAARASMISNRAARLLYRFDAEPVENPLTALQALAGRALALEQVIGGIVNELSSIRYDTEAGGEQLRSEVAVLERAMDRCGKILVDIAKLNIEERLAKVTERQVELVGDALALTLADMGLPADQQRAARQGVARHLRVA